MLLTTLFYLSGLGALGGLFPHPAPLQPSTADREEGGLVWFEGSWDELMATAKREKKLVFVDFWTEW